ncbi:MAG: type III pantothenate kinase [Luminiphilus sp.]|nr:type III pantothenate kinase [Luminiphilus sp.]
MTHSSLFLLLDVGNSAIKWRLGDAASLLEAGGECDGQAALCKAVAGLDWGCVAVASVAGDAIDEALVGALQSVRDAPCWRAQPQRECLGLTNGYPDPGTMGVDRWVAMIGAWRELGGPLCIIDAGTATTVDLVNQDGRHEGGFILPGADLMRHALSSGTGRIRVAALSASGMRPGTSTQECVSAGAWRATFGAVQSVLSDFPQHRAVITGGNASHLLSLGLVAEYRPNVVMEGLRLSVIQQLDDRAP